MSHKIDWNGSPYVFCNHLVRRLPGDYLQQVLQALIIGAAGEQYVAALSARIAAAAGDLTTTAGEDALRRYHQQAVAELADSRYQLDSRFVQLTLLIDQGQEAQGIRFVQDPQRGRYESLATLLDEIEQRAVVLLGRPGSGKTTLLRRLQLEKAWAALETIRQGRAAGPIPFFVSLNGYRGAQPGEPAPPPYEWLAQEWRLRHPAIADFETLFRSGRLLLLLDGLNEMPHRDRDDYRARIGRWQAFLQQNRHSGNTFVFSCRSLDYSASLSSEALPVPQVRVEPLAPAQIEEFLRLHLADDAVPIWETLRRDVQQLALFASPFFLRLLVDQVRVTGEMPQGQAGLLTGFVRRALHREVVERGGRLFTPDRLLSEDDVQQVIQQEWPVPYDLPAEGILIPRLESLAYGMQDEREAGEAGQVRVLERTARQLLAQPEASDLPADIIAAGIRLNVLDKDLAKREVLFFHQLVQEYFAARVLARTPEPKRVEAAWRADTVIPSLAETLAGA